MRVVWVAALLGLLLSGGFCGGYYLAGVTQRVRQAPSEVKQLADDSRLEFAVTAGGSARAAVAVFESGRVRFDWLAVAACALDRAPERASARVICQVALAAREEGEQ